LAHGEVRKRRDPETGFAADGEVSPINDITLLGILFRAAARRYFWS
jgi:hypothetical protein